MIKEPPVQFSGWTAWGEREKIRNAHLPGVYLLARHNGMAPARVDPQDREIVYIGETSDGSLLGRWQQFNRSASEGKPGHRGGLLFNEYFGDELSDLYVAAFVPEGLSRELRGFFIRSCAARLLWEWARRWEAAPICNGRDG